MEISEKGVVVVKKGARNQKIATTEETVIRFSNIGRHPKPNELVANSSASKQHCVGDYSCCGHVP